MPSLQHFLEGGKGRVFVFEPVAADAVMVRQRRRNRVVSERKLTRSAAVTMYRLLRRNGFRRW